MSTCTGWSKVPLFSHWSTTLYLLFLGKEEERGGTNINVCCKEGDSQKSTEESRIICSSAAEILNWTWSKWVQNWRSKSENLVDEIRKSSRRNPNIGSNSENRVENPRSGSKSFETEEIRDRNLGRDGNSKRRNLRRNLRRNSREKDNLLCLWSWSASLILIRNWWNSQKMNKSMVLISFSDLLRKIVIWEGGRCRDWNPWTVRASFATQCFS